MQCFPTSGQANGWGLCAEPALRGVGSSSHQVCHHPKDTDEFLGGFPQNQPQYQHCQDDDAAADAGGEQIGKEGRACSFLLIVVDHLPQLVHLAFGQPLAVGKAAIKAGIEPSKVSSTISVSRERWNLLLGHGLVTVAFSFSALPVSQTAQHRIGGCLDQPSFPCTGRQAAWN